MRIKYLIVSSALVLSINSYADTILSCTEEKSTSISWEEKGIVSKAGLEANAINTAKTPVQITLVISDKKTILKGNMDQVVLSKVTESTYLETTGFGNVLLWTIVKGRNGLPTYVFQLKAYDLAGPYSTTMAYKCN